MPPENSSSLSISVPRSVVPRTRSWILVKSRKSIPSQSEFSLHSSIHRSPTMMNRGRYLDNPNVGSAKVPSILYYDRNGHFRGVENGAGLQDDESLLQMRWFVGAAYFPSAGTHDHRWKLMIGPTQPSAELKNHMSTDLPRGKTIIDVFSDFMGYLFRSTRTLFVSSDPNAENRWNSVSHKIELVLTHPNGWGGSQQSQLRAAAVRAGIVPGTREGLSRVHFVTEGEASFNFCVTHTQAGETMKVWLCRIPFTCARLTFQ